MAAEGDVNIKFTADLEDVKKELQTLREQFQAFVSSLKTIGTAAFAFTALKTVFGEISSLIKGSIGTVQHWMAAAEASELINIRLGIAVKNAGDQVGFTTKSLMAYASQLANVTIFSSDEIKSTERKLITMGVYGEKLKEIIDLATQTASVEGRALEATAVAINRAMGAIAATDAKASSVRRMLSGAGVFLSPQELAAIESSANKQQALMKVLTNRYAEAAAQIAETGFGVKKALGNIWSDIEASLGGGFLQIVVAARDGLRILLVEIKRIAEAFEVWMKSIVQGDAVTSFIKGFTEKLIYAFAFIEEHLARIPLYFKQIKAELMEIQVIILEMIASLPKLVFGSSVDKAKRALEGGAKEYTPEQTAKITQMQKEWSALNRKYEREKESEVHDPERNLRNQKAAAEAYKKLEDYVASIPKKGGALKASQEARAEADKATKEAGDANKAIAERYTRMMQDQWYQDFLKMTQGVRTWFGKITKTVMEQDVTKDVLAFPKEVLNWFKPQQPLPITDLTAGQKVALGFGNISGDPFGNKPRSESIEAHDAAIDRELKKMALAFVPKQESKSSIEDAASVFKRIQVSAAGVTLTEAEKKSIEYYTNIADNIKAEKAEAAERSKAWKNINNLKQGVGP